jgi:hypothetical protein
MIFKDLYQFAESLETPIVSVKELARRVQSHHDDVGEVTFTPVVLDENTTLGYIVYGYDRSSAYEEPFRIMGIRYSDSLNRCHRRFVCCKELMHAFDSPAERTSSRDRFLQLMRELESPPLVRSPMLDSEIQAEWMALLALCPKSRRDALKLEWEAKDKSPRQIAEVLKIPEAAISALMGDNYDVAYARFVAEA